MQESAYQPTTCQNCVAMMPCVCPDIADKVSGSDMAMTDVLPRHTDIHTDTHTYKTLMKHAQHTYVRTKWEILLSLSVHISKYFYYILWSFFILEVHW